MLLLLPLLLSFNDFYVVDAVAYIILYINTFSHKRNDSRLVKERKDALADCQTQKEQTVIVFHNVSGHHAHFPGIMIIFSSMQELLLLFGFFIFSVPF